jgi:UDP-N-acetylmuramoyl-tripeptide--D-alanyl-D-alanine ligase
VAQHNNDNNKQRSNDIERQMAVLCRAHLQIPGFIESANPKEKGGQKMEPILASKLLAGLAPEGFVPQDQEITYVTTDSREICEGCVFVAFPGARFDGHDFAAEALRQGAAYVVLNHPVEGVPAEKTILCEDSYRAMMILGANYRAQYNPIVVGVTGSVGKTTTKQFCYAVLNAFGNTIKTEGNQNNELGLPRTLFRLTKDTEYAVVEMGMSHAGEIERLSKCARPSAGVITCIGVSHIENLGSRENICKAKLELCEGLAEGAPLILNGDDEYLRAAQLPAHVKPVWYSLKDQDADVWASDISQTKDGMSFLLEDPENGRFSVTIPAMGKHNVANALAAYCVATRLGLDARTAVKALKTFEQTGMRQHVVEHNGVTVIEDCYNANPDSMRAALAMFREYPCKRRIALLGDMLELGDISREAHEELGKLAANSDLYALITYGEQAHRTAITAAAKGLKTVHAANYREAADALLHGVQPGDAILVKASRGMALEKALELFYAEYQL